MTNETNNTKKSFIELRNSDGIIQPSWFFQVRISEWNEEENTYRDESTTHNFATAEKAYNFIIKYEQSPKHVEDEAYVVIMEKISSNHHEYVEELGDAEDLLEN
tara:strand:+ start:730 stop:1041 length:312 start_codon:yes stop_codon:yes gene_type:complete